MDEFRITFQQLTTYAWVVSIIISIFFGTFPLIAGLKLNNSKYAYIGFIGSILLGAIGVVLAFPFAVIMHWLILRNASLATVPDPEPDGDVNFTPADNA